MLKDAVKYWHRILYDNKAPKYVYKYIESRGIDLLHKRIKQTGLGWTGGSTPFKLPPVLLTKNGDKEFFRKSLVLPIVSINKKITQITGRALGNSDKPHIHLREKLCGFLGENLLVDKDYIIFVEGFFDYLTLKQRYDNVGGLLGCGGFKKSWGNKIKRFKVIYSALDQDEAGDRGTKRIAQVAKEVGIPVKRIKFPFKDVNDFFKKHNADDFFGCMRTAETVQVERGRPFKRVVLDDALDKMLKLMNGADLYENSKGYKTVCPFHSESEPSMHIYADGYAHCFGCMWSGNAIDFAIDRLGLSRTEARVYVETL